MDNLRASQSEVFVLYRVIVSSSAAALAFIVSFVVFNVAYIKWAVWRYPQANSMAGLSAFIGGFEVGAIVAVLCFGVVYYWLGRRISD
jgi:hypothetical protein